MVVSVDAVSVRLQLYITKPTQGFTELQRGEASDGGRGEVEEGEDDYEDNSALPQPSLEQPDTSGRHGAIPGCP